MARTDVNVKSERNPSARDPEKRVQPFASVLLVALFVIPLFCLLMRVFIAAGGDGIKWLIVWLTLSLFGAVMPGIALAIGYKVTKRIPFVTWHAALTAHAFAVAVSLSVLPGWQHVSAGKHWWDDFFAGVRNVFSVPMWMVVVYTIASLCLAGSWLLYRIDAFRAATGADGDGQGGLEALVKWPKGAKVRPETIVVDEFAITAEVDHEGIPLGQIQNSVKSLEEHPNIIRGRSSVVGGEHGGRSTVRMVHTDPHSEWRVWPGLSHPGGLYHEPLRTSYYSTGETQWYSFVRTPDGYRSKLAPNFASPNGSFKGSQGMTGAGKSGDAAIECAEVLSRRDAQLIYVDTAKLMQNAGWCLDFCSLAAGSREASSSLFAALRRLGEYRAKTLGEAGVRDFNHEAVVKTGMSWLHIFADEFDVASQGADMNWLATKGRSVGIRFAFTLPRATGENINTNVRAAVGMWCQFGISQDYDKGFVVSQETIEAGANPEQFGATTPGVHYLDRAPGIDKRMYAIDCRSYKTREDYGDLRRAVEAARATFTPMTFTEGELKALGSVATSLRPSVVRNGHMGQDPDAETTQPMNPIEAPALADEAGLIAGTSDADRQTLQRALEIQRNQQKGTPVNLLKKVIGVDDLAIDPETRALLDEIPDPDLSDIESQVGYLDGRTPVAQPDPDAEDRSALPDIKPQAPNTPAAIQDFNEALGRMVGRGVTEFGNKDVQDEMRFAWSAGEVSKRFTACTEGRAVDPPNVTIERLGRGRFMFVHLDGQAPGNNR